MGLSGLGCGKMPLQQRVAGALKSKYEPLKCKRHLEKTAHDYEFHSYQAWSVLFHFSDHPLDLFASSRTSMALDKSDLERLSTVRWHSLMATFGFLDCNFGAFIGLHKL